MDESTTTEATVAEGGSEQTIQGVAVNDQGQAVEPQPEATEQAEAAEATEQTTTEDQQVETKPSEDDELSTWAEKKGLELDSDNARKAAKMAREAERAMHQKAQRASELEKSIETRSDEVAEQIALNTGQDPELLKRLQRVEIKEAIRDFWNTPTASGELPDKSLEPAMSKLVMERPYLAGDLESLHAIAMVQSGKINAVKSQGGQEALKSLAQNQQAAVPRGNAVNPSGTNSVGKITPQNVDQVVAGMTAEEYAKRLPEINAALAG
jgi:hypothetical protein